jgi:triacylglycerol lipase
MNLLLLLLASLIAFAAPKLENRQPLKNPIVLLHGATEKGSRLKVGMFDFGEYFFEIDEYLAATRTPIYVVEVSTNGSIGERAAVLKNFLDTDLKGKKVNIVAHSLGGLDARFCATILKCESIASITTIGTPHLGSPSADWAIRQLEQKSVWYWLFRLVGYKVEERRFLAEITTDHMQKRFNPKVLDLPQIQYFSVVSEASFTDGSMSYVMWFTKRWLEAENHPLNREGNDGLVPLLSQYWGKTIGKYHMDHMAQMNHHELRAKDFTELSLEMYARIYDNLKAADL